MDFNEMFKEFNMSRNARNISLDKDCIKLLNEIKSTRDFFESFSFLQFGRDSFVFATPTSLGNLFCANGILISVEQTLESLESCCKLGNFSDAYILLRKYRDDLFFYLDVCCQGIFKNSYQQIFIDSKKPIKQGGINYLMS